MRKVQGFRPFDVSICCLPRVPLLACRTFHFERSWRHWPSQTILGRSVSTAPPRIVGFFVTKSFWVARSSFAGQVPKRCQEGPSMLQKSNHFEIISLDATYQTFVPTSQWVWVFNNRRSTIGWMILDVWLKIFLLRALAGFSLWALCRMLPHSICYSCFLAFHLPRVPLAWKLLYRRCCMMSVQSWDFARHGTCSSCEKLAWRCIVDGVGLFTELLDWVTWERKKIERRVQHCPTLQLKLFQHVPTCFKMFPFHVWPDAWTAASSGELAGGKRLWTLWAAWIAWMAWIAWRRAREMAWPWHDLRHLATENTQTKWH